MDGSGDIMGMEKIMMGRFQQHRTTPQLWRMWKEEGGLVSASGKSLCMCKKWDGKFTHDHEKTQSCVDGRNGWEKRGRLHKNIMIYAKTLWGCDDIIHIDPGGTKKTRGAGKKQEGTRHKGENEDVRI